MEAEIWKNIQCLEGLYQVSNKGNVKSLRNNITLKPGLCIAGYQQVNLWKDGVCKIKMIHRLVAEAFLEKSDKYVNHKDFNKLNNNVENLEWISNRDNSYHYQRSVGIEPGVQKIGKKYQVRIRLNGIKEYFGRFKTKEEAIKIRDEIISTPKEKLPELLVLYRSKVKQLKPNEKLERNINNKQ